MAKRKAPYFLLILLVLAFIPPNTSYSPLLMEKVEKEQCLNSNIYFWYENPLSRLIYWNYGIQKTDPSTYKITLYGPFGYPLHTEDIVLDNKRNFANSISRGERFTCEPPTR